MLGWIFISIRWLYSVDKVARVETTSGAENPGGDDLKLNLRTGSKNGLLISKFQWFRTRTSYSCNCPLGMCFWSVAGCIGPLPHCQNNIQHSLEREVRFGSHVKETQSMTHWLQKTSTMEEGCGGAESQGNGEQSKQQCQRERGGGPDTDPQGHISMTPDTSRSVLHQSILQLSSQSNLTIKWGLPPHGSSAAPDALLLVHHSSENLQVLCIR